MKKRMIFLLLTLTALLLTGCAMQTVEEMYAVPKRSAEYSSLQSAIDAAMMGRTYAAPVSGENQQSVQMADLDGDGVEEYLVFAMGNADKRLQVLIFRQEDETCSLWEVIESSGTAFEQVEYIQFDEQPGCELVLGSQVSDQVLRSVTVYSFSQGTAEQLLMVGYTKFLTCDLDANDRQELMVLRPGEAEATRGMAVLYSSRGGQIQRSVETELSEEVSHIRRITTSALQDGTPAVFVASSVDEEAIVTDIFALLEGKFTNVSFSTEANTSIQTLRNFYVYAEDIDEDGVLELPSLLTMKAVSHWEDEEEKFLLRWFAMDVDGREVDKLFTFHYYVGGWYVQLDKEWASRVSVEQGSGIYIFYMWNESYQEATPLFTIYVFTGSTRDEDAVKDGRFAVYRSEGVAYAGKLEPSAAEYGITEEYVINSFRLIRKDWRTGEN
ncbi:MAG: hypothetical protein ACI4PH_00450 [Faecousia sp.]